MNRRLYSRLQLYSAEPAAPLHPRSTNKPPLCFEASAILSIPFFATFINLVLDRDFDYSDKSSRPTSTLDPDSPKVRMHNLVTGGSGFIGSHLTEFLLNRSESVTVIDDLSTGRGSNLAHLAGNPGLTIIEADLGNPDLVQAVCRQADRVFHLAAAVGVALIAKHPYESIHRNIYPTQLLLEALRGEQKAGRHVPLFLASTSEVYGKNPKSVWSEDDDLVFGATTKPRWSYGVSKAIDEFLALACVREHALPVVIGRFFNVVGPRQTVLMGWFCHVSSKPR